MAILKCGWKDLCGFLKEMTILDFLLALSFEKIDFTQN